MVEQYRIILGQEEAEIVEKKSRFIATVRPVATEEEAKAFIDEMKKKYYDARHNCSAFVVGTKKELVRSSDDGEPSGTAGKPMLEVLMGSDIVNIAVVVTRYFGGTLLGTGGLVRAYTQATQEGLSACKKAVMCAGKSVKIHTDYNTIGKILYELSQRNLEQEDSEYTDVISISLTVPSEEFDEFEKKITEISAGKSRVEVLEDVFFAKVESA